MWFVVSQTIIMRIISVRVGKSVSLSLCMSASSLRGCRQVHILSLAANTPWQWGPQIWLVARKQSPIHEVRGCLIMHFHTGLRVCLQTEVRACLYVHVCALMYDCLDCCARILKHCVYVQTSHIYLFFLWRRTQFTLHIRHWDGYMAIFYTSLQLHPSSPTQKVPHCSEDRPG